MKRIILIAIGIICIVFFSTAQNSKKEKNDLSEFVLTGKVKLLIENNYELADSIEGNNKILNSIDSIYLNESGNRVLFIHKAFENNDLDTNNINKVIENNNLDTNSFIYKIIKKNPKKTKPPDQNYRYSYKYNENGDLIEWYSYNENYKPSDGFKVKCICKYDNKGNNTESYVYNSKDSLIRKKIRKYDMKRNVIELCEYDSKETLLNRNTFVYNEKGDKIEQYEHKSDGSFNMKYICKYDENRKIIEINGDFPNNSFNIRNTYKYNDKGIKIEYNNYLYGDIKGIKYSYNYEYDKLGNWIKRYEYINGNYYKITEREIIYY